MENDESAMSEFLGRFCHHNDSQLEKTDMEKEGTDNILKNLNDKLLSESEIIGEFAEQNLEI